MEKLTEGYDWKKCHYCESDYGKWCAGRVIEEDKGGLPQVIEVKCRYCGAVYQVHRVVSWRIERIQGVTNKKLWPRSIKEAGEKLLSKMSDSDKKSAIVFRVWFLFLWSKHLCWVRLYTYRAFGLREGNKELLDSCNTSDVSVAVEVIMFSVWKALMEDTNVSDDWRDFAKYLLQVEDMPDDLKDYTLEKIYDEIFSIYKKLDPQRKKPYSSHRLSQISHSCGVKRK